MPRSYMHSRLFVAVSLVIALSVVLPWVGVVAANAGPTVERHRQTAVVARSDSPEGTPTLDHGRVIDAD